MKRQSETTDEQSAVDRVTGTRIDSCPSKRRTVTWSREWGERRSEGDPAHDEHPYAGRFQHEARESEPRFARLGPAGSDDGAGGGRGDDDRLQDDPAFTASSQRWRVDG